MAATGSLSPQERELATALAAAKNAALAARSGDDGGSANLDCAFLRARPGLTAKTVRKAAEAAGVSIYRCEARFWRGWFIQVGQGQGAMNTRMAEAATRALKDFGLEATVYYMVD